MSVFNLLIIEDDDRDIQICKSTITRYMKEKKRNINVEYCKDKESALSMISNKFDGTIIDLKLDDTDDYVGNDLVSEIRKRYRIPISILTGTPGQYDGKDDFIKAYKKGETGYGDILDVFYEIYDTGLTKILGGRGLIEDHMTDIFWSNILPQLEKWKQYCTCGKDTQSALLRVTLNHLMDVLDEDAESYFPEEMYINPPLAKRYKTGSIVKKKESEGKYVILSPACDMAIRNDKPKTDRVLLCCIESFVKGKSLIKKANRGEVEIRSKAIDQIDRIIKNNCALYYHFLPQTMHFEGGVVNFRKIETYSIKEFHSLFSEIKVQLTSPFIKDVIARFSSYYARQGQPDLNFDELRDEIVNYEF